MPSDGSSKSKNLQRATPLTGLRILIVDDVEEHHVLYSRILTLGGAAVEKAMNGAAGIHKAMRGKFDVILMDLSMPEMDGLSATQQLREHGYGGAIIALTAHAMREDRARSLSYGFDEHLSKPIDRNNLIDAVHRYSLLNRKNDPPSDDPS